MLLSHLFLPRENYTTISLTPIFRAGTPVEQCAHTVSNEIFTPVGRNLQKAISSTNLAKNYVSGMYELNSKTKIYVNTGIGTTHVSGRLGVVPEISIFHIYL